MTERPSQTGIDYKKLFPGADRGRLAQRLIDRAREISGIFEILGVVNKGSGVCDKLIFLARGYNYEANTIRSRWFEAYERECPNILQRTMLNHPMLFTQEEWDQAKAGFVGRTIVPIWQREEAA